MENRNKPILNYRQTSFCKMDPSYVISSSFLQNVTPEVAAFSQDVHLEYKKQMNQKMSKQTMEVKC